MLHCPLCAARWFWGPAASRRGGPPSVPPPGRVKALAAAVTLAITLAAAAGPSWAAPAVPRADVAGELPVGAPSACRRLPPLPTPPAEGDPSRHDVTRYGARADDDQPDDAAVERALAALQPGDWLVFPPGRYLQSRSWFVTTPGVTLWGPGARVHALDPADLTIGLRADGQRLIGFTLSAATGRRRSEMNTARITVAPGRQPREDLLPVSGVLVRGNRIEPATDVAAELPAGASGGIFVYRAERFTIAENTLRGTLADGIHITAASHDGRVVGNRVTGTGDDPIATVSYLGRDGMARLRAGQAPLNEPLSEPVSDIVIEGNVVGGNPWGRGLAVIGSRRITLRGNRVTGVEHAAGIIVAQEGVYQTPGAREVLVEGNAIRNIQVAPPHPDPARRRPRTGHAGIEIHAFGNDAADLARPAIAERLAVRDVLVRDNLVEQVAASGIRVGADSAPGLIADVRLLRNRVERSGGSAVQLVQPQAVSRLCPPGAVTPECRGDDGPIPGARVDCASLP